MQKHSFKTIHKLMLKGSLVCLSLILLITSQAASAWAGVDGLDDPRSMDLSTAKNGVVRVVAVTEDGEGNETVRAVSSGFIVSMAGSSPYVVTTLHAVDYGEDTRIRIIIKNDSFAEARVDTALLSSNKDFCILQVDGQLSNKNSIPLRVAAYDEDSVLSSGDTVTLLGFNSGLGSDSDFSASDVTANTGKLTATSDSNGGWYEAEVDTFSGADGGVLVDEDGYAIGLVNMEKGGSGKVTALDAADIESLLDSAGINCRTKDKDLLYNDLYDLYEAYSTGKINYKGKSKESKQAISAAYNNAYDVLSNTPYDRDALAKALADFREADGSSKSKMDGILTGLAIILIPVIIFLAVKLIMLNRWYKKNGQDGEAPFDKPQKKDKKEKKSKKKGKGDAPQRAAPAAMAQPMLRICSTGQMFAVAGDIISLGKSEDCNIAIVWNNKVSRRHAVIENIYGSYYLFDQNSTNGTYLNDMPVGSDGVRLMPGDIIRLANEQIEFMQ